MRFLGRSLTAVFLVAVTLGLLTLAGDMIYSALKHRWAQQSSPMPARERVFVVNVITITPETVTPVLTAFGELRSRRTLELRTSAGGTVTMLAEGFVEGGKVEAGEVLLRLDPTDFEAALEVARTDVVEAQADRLDAETALTLARDDLANAEKQADLRAAALTRQRDLVSRGVGTEAAVETAELAAASAEQAVLSRRQALANAEARVNQAENMLARRNISLADAERRLAETVMIAEFTGTLSQVSVVEGGLVTQNERIGQIVDAQALEASFRVSTAQYSRLLDSAGRLVPAEIAVRLDVAGVDLVTTGRIERESAEVGEGQTGRLLFAKLDEARGFRPGDFVTVEIREPALDGVVVLPATALDAAGRVLALGENDRLEEAQVELLRRQGDAVLVRAPGLAGREVVAERTPSLGPGIRVRAARPVTGGEEPPAPEEPEMIELSPERRAALVAFVEGNQMMPADVKSRILTALKQDKVPAQMVERLESRMGG
jgi:multidrug efflux pump subunit AcrA (membrane-fusion protein)